MILIYDPEIDRYTLKDETGNQVQYQFEHNAIDEKSSFTIGDIVSQTWLRHKQSEIRIARNGW